jgi:hypothetical protein
MVSARRHRARGAVILGVAALFATASAGCFGRFRAMNAVYDFNRSASDNTVVRSLVLFALLVIPVYELAFFIDWIVLNTLDFFNGTSKVAVEKLPDGTEVRMAKLDADTVRVTHVDTSGRETSVDVVRAGANAGYVRRADGRIVGTVERLSDGRLIEQAR